VLQNRGPGNHADHYRSDSAVLRGGISLYNPLA
jgi:hypothetical protein